jgi:predicted nucleotide-binding protein
MNFLTLRDLSTVIQFRAFYSLIPVPAAGRNWNTLRHRILNAGRIGQDSMTPTESVRPVVFIGSSTADLDAVRAVQQQLQSLRKVAQVRIWDELVEGISQSMLESLVSRLSTFDFGVLIFTPDDLVKSPTEDLFVVRDNVLIELGLCLGRLTRERTSVLAADDPKLKIPSDLGGIIYGRFKLQNRYGELLTEVGPACSSIASAIMNTGKLNAVHRLASEIEVQKQKNERTGRAA